MRKTEKVQYLVRTLIFCMLLTIYADHTAYVVEAANSSKNSVTVTFDANGGSVPTSSKKVTPGSEYGELPLATKSGYVFDGWFTSNSSGTQVVSDTIVNKNSDHTLYAKWVSHYYTITYNLNDGENAASNPTSYTQYDSTITLGNPKKTGYIFDGWYSDSSYSNSKNSIPAGSTGDMTFYAKWRECDHTNSTAKPTCTKYANCSECGAIIHANLHDFSLSGRQPVWQWTTADDAKILVSCKKPGCNEILEAKAIVTETVLENSTCSTNGIARCRAEIIYEGVSYTKEDTFRLPYSEHQYIRYPGYADATNASLGHRFKCECGALSEIQPHSDNAGVMEEASTTEHEGLLVYDCIHCHYKTRYATIPKLTVEHTDDSFHIYDVGVALTREGQELLGHYQRCACGVSNNSLEQHRLEHVPTRDASEFLNAKEVEYCKKCGWSHEYEIPNTATGNHDYSTEWSYDTLQHWHGCTSCNLPSAKGSLANHDFGAWRTVVEPSNFIEGQKMRTCSVCGYVESAMIERNPIHSYSDNFIYDNLRHWRECPCGCTSEDNTHTFGSWKAAESSLSRASSYSLYPDEVLMKRKCTVCDYEETRLDRGPTDLLVTFDANSGSVNTPTTTIKKGTPYGTLPTPVRDGYTFDGWYTSKTGGSRVTSDTINEGTGSHVLYARWVEDNGAGGSNVGNLNGQNNSGRAGSNRSGYDDVPKTGENNAGLILILLMILSAFGGGYALYVLKYRGDKSRED